MIALLDAPILTDDFDLRTYLTPGVYYDHMMLRKAYHDACNAGMWCKEGDPHFREGATFREAVYSAWYSGELEMTQAKCRNGEEADFFTAVVDAYWPEHKDFQLVEGHLVLWITDGEDQ